MQNRYDKCPNCMQALGQGEDVCPYCGFDVSGYEEKPNCLRPFTVLQGKYSDPQDESERYEGALQRA